MAALNNLSAPNLLKIVRKGFSNLPDTNKNRRSDITMSDCLMSALAIFGAKYPSLLKFEESLLSQEGNVRHNLESLYGVKQPLSDTYLREELDELNPSDLSPIFKAIFAQLQRAKKLEAFTYLDGFYLMSVDGTGFFSSKKFFCENCCVKTHRDNTKSYYHLMHCASIVHPEIKEVIPLAPEAIVKQDGYSKNDCEQQATKRLLTRFRREHPHLKNYSARR